MRKPNHIKKKTKQFTVLVDSDLLERANKARKHTWGTYVERMLNSLVVEGINEDYKKKTTR